MTMLEKIPCRTLIKIRKKRSHSGTHILRNKKKWNGVKVHKRQEKNEVQES